MYKSICFKINTLLKRFVIMLIFCTFMINVLFAYHLQAMSIEQRNLYRKGIQYYEIDTCETAGAGSGNASISGVTAGAGEPEGATFPNLDPAAAAEAINKYIQQTNPDSKLKGLGETIVASAKNSNVSPFLIVAIAQKESGLAGPGDFNVKNGNNAFGRTALASQPNFQGSRLWYKWTTMKASVDHTATENKNAAGGGDVASYIRKQYPQELDSGDIAAFFKKYAPEYENDTAKYISDVGNGIKKMVSLAKSLSGTDTTPSASEPDPTTPATTEPEPVTSDPCCLQAGGSSDSGTTVSGNGNEEIVWNFLVSDMGFSDIQAAGIMGNIKQESSFDFNALNPGSQAYGIVQWFAGRKTALINFAATKGKPISDKATQLAFLKKELEGSYKASVLDPMKATNNIAEATRIWLERFEVPCLPGSGACDAEMNIRLPNAVIFKNKYGGGAGGPTTGEPPSTDPDAQPAAGGGCIGGGGGGSTGGQFSAITFANKEELVSKALAHPKIVFGNYGSATDQKNDLKDCLTENALVALVAMADQSGVKIPINDFASGHGGCGGGKSLHNAGKAIDIGYYGVGDPNNNANGNKLYSYLYKNRNELKIDELIWKNPPAGQQCVNNLQPTSCNTTYAAVINDHNHHIHVGFK